jgi:hypothetical protein
VACTLVVALAVLLFLWQVVFRTIPEHWPNAQTRSEITELTLALAAFQTLAGVSNVPSRVKLSETCNYPNRDLPGTLDHDSVRYLRKLWPRIDLSPGSPFDWNGDGKVRGDWVLEGDECLVFFLGGIPEGAGGPAPSCGGFAPFDRPDPTEREGKRPPFYEFRSSRLRDIHGRGFLSYTDACEGQPYAYFSAYGVENGYNRYGGTDCPALGVWPYAEALGPAPRYLKPRSFQILSAGPDGLFGPGTDAASHTWSPDRDVDLPPEGWDDLSNFSDVPLGGKR